MAAGAAGPGRASVLIAERGLLFVYGTLQFPSVLRVLLGRVPRTQLAAAAGFRAAALAGRSYPGLVAGVGTVNGLVLAGLTPAETLILDAFEAGPYDFRGLTLTDGRTAWAYVWTDASAVLPGDWSAQEFAASRLGTFVVQCRVWRANYAAGSSGTGSNGTGSSGTGSSGTGSSGTGGMPRPQDDP